VSPKRHAAKALSPSTGSRHRLSKMLTRIVSEIPRRSYMHYGHRGFIADDIYVNTLGYGRPPNNKAIGELKIAVTAIVARWTQDAPKT